MSAESDYIRAERDNIESCDTKIQKTENWHKELLLASRQQSIISQKQFDALRKLLVFRHMQIHGYGYMLDEQRLRELAEPLLEVTKNFLCKIQ